MIDGRVRNVSAFFFNYQTTLAHYLDIPTPRSPVIIGHDILNRNLNLFLNLLPILLQEFAAILMCHVLDRERNCDIWKLD
jgi:hypothetical protein